MSYSSILSAVDCETGSLNSQSQTSEQASCHDEDTSDSHDPVMNCQHCDYFGCSVISSIPSQLIKSENLSLNNFINYKIDNSPSIPQSAIFHPPKS